MENTGRSMLWSGSSKFAKGNLQCRHAVKTNEALIEGEDAEVKLLCWRDKRLQRVGQHLEVHSARPSAIFSEQLKRPGEHGPNTQDCILMLKKERDARKNAGAHR